MSFFNKERESTGALESKYAKLEKEKERLEKEKERLELRREVRDREKEIKRLSHPYQEDAKGVAKGTGGRIARFTGSLIKEGATSFAKTNQTLKSRGRRIRYSQSGRRSFMAPTGQDNSLSGGIARNDWHDRNIMETNFFGESNNRDLLGTQSGREMLSGNKEKKKNQRYY